LHNAYAHYHDQTASHQFTSFVFRQIIDSIVLSELTIVNQSILMSCPILIACCCCQISPERSLGVASCPLPIEPYTRHFIASLILPPPPPINLNAIVSRVLTPPARINNLSNTPCWVKKRTAAMPKRNRRRGTLT